VNPWLDASLLAAALLSFGLLNAVLVAAETSLVKLRYTLLDETALDKLRGDKRLGPLLDRSEKAARGIRFGRIASAVGFGMALHAALAMALGGDTAGAPARLALLLAALLAAALLYIILAEVVPRSLALAYTEPTLRASAPFLRASLILFTPLLALLAGASRKLLAALRVPPDERIHPLDIEVQLRALGEETEGLSVLLRKIVANTLRMRELEVSDVLLPRNQVQFFDIEDPVSENLEKARHTGHTRFPLCRRDLDHCIGLVHIKDVFRFRGELAKLDLRSIRREIISLGADEPLEFALQKLMRLKMHMALVVDQFGGTLGVITLERILEEVVGEIQDEFDVMEELHQIKRLDDERFRVSGLTPIHDVEEALNVSVSNEEISTFGGLITAELGVIPKEGEELILADPGLDVRIDEVDERRIISATVRVRAPEPENEEQPR